MKPSSNREAMVCGSSKTTSGNIFYISIHTTFFFRPEVQVHSEEGLNVYGAVTWGQFLSIKGLTTIADGCTPSNVDVADMYAEKIVRKKTTNFYEYESKLLPVTEKNITINYLENGKLVLKIQNLLHQSAETKEGKWISLSLITAL
jgi:acyl-homoserine lactone acylase PvdQ